MIEIFKRLATWKLIIPFIILFSVFTFHLFPKYQAEIKAIAGEEIDILDVRASYRFREVKIDFEKMQPEGRAIHQFLTGKIDMVYPLVYGPMLILLLGFFLKGTFKSESKKIYFAFIPIFLVITDYLENFNTLGLLRDFPNITQEGVMWGATLTQLKHFFSLLSLILLLIVFTLWIIKKLTSISKT